MRCIGGTAGHERQRLVQQFEHIGVTPRPFSNANQWAASVGGPIFKDKTFFFVDTEGLRFVLPNVDSVTIPTPAFATAVVNNVAAMQPE